MRNRYTNLTYVVIGVYLSIGGYELWVCGVGARGFWRYRMHPYFYLFIETKQFITPGVDWLSGAVLKSANFY